MTFHLWGGVLITPYLEAEKEILSLIRSLVLLDCLGLTRLFYFYMIILKGRCSRPMHTGLGLKARLAEEEGRFRTLTWPWEIPLLSSSVIDFILSFPPQFPSSLFFLSPLLTSSFSLSLFLFTFLPLFLLHILPFLFFPPTSPSSPSLSSSSDPPSPPLPPLPSLFLPLSSPLSPSYLIFLFLFPFLLLSFFPSPFSLLLLLPFSSPLLISVTLPFPLSFSPPYSFPFSLFPLYYCVARNWTQLGCTLSHELCSWAPCSSW